MGHAADDGAPGIVRESAPLDAPDAADDAPSKRSGGLLFLAIAVVMAADLALDALGGPWALHLVAELGVVALALAGLWRLWAQILRERRAARALRTDLVAAREDARRFRDESQTWARGLATAIDTQLDAWSFSPAEKEVALLLLKGLALKEIAQVRGVSERTARQQALAAYKKAGVAGRAELSAFFLEDLLGPR